MPGHIGDRRIPGDHRLGQADGSHEQRHGVAAATRLQQLGELGDVCLLAAGRVRVDHEGLALGAGDAGGGAGGHARPDGVAVGGRPGPREGPAPAQRPFDTGDDPSTSSALAAHGYLMLVLVALAAVPCATLVLLGGLWQRPALQAAGVLVGVATGGLLYWSGGRVAARRLADRGAELMDLLRLGPQARAEPDHAGLGGEPAAAPPRWRDAAV
jgi:hypothetical protein